jgi:CRISPR-associated endoribonuclease Cas6
MAWHDGVANFLKQPSPCLDFKNNSFKLKNMRIKVLFESKVNLNLPKDYRRYFLSFLKKVFEKAGFENIFEMKKYRPYTFSVWLGENFKIDEEVSTDTKISLLFSSGDPVIITNFYNGVLRLKKERYKPIGELLEIKDVVLLPYKEIKANKAIFKTIGVCVFNNPQASKKDFKSWYITPYDDLDKFNEILYQRTNDRFKYLTGRKDAHPIKVNLLEDYPIKEVMVKHYNGYVRGFKGVFELSGSPEIIQFVYDYGFGIRTGQGFGLLELVKEL